MILGNDFYLMFPHGMLQMISPSEPYVPFFHAKGENGDVAKDPHPPLIPLKTAEGYDNQGIYLANY